MGVSKNINGEELLNLLHSLNDSCTKQNGNICKSISITPVEYRVLSKVSLDTPMKATQFSKELKLSPSRTSRVISKLQKSNLILVEHPPTDARISQISITPNGVELKEEIAKEHRKCHKKIEETLSEDERLNFMAIAEKLISAL